MLETGTGEEVRYEYVDEYGNVVATSTDGQNFVPTHVDPATGEQTYEQGRN